MNIISLQETEMQQKRSSGDPREDPRRNAHAHELLEQKFAGIRDFHAADVLRSEDVRTHRGGAEFRACDSCADGMQAVVPGCCCKLGIDKCVFAYQPCT